MSKLTVLNQTRAISLVSKPERYGDTDTAHRNTSTNRLTTPAIPTHSSTHNARGSFGETVLGRLFGAGPCFFPRPVAT